MNLITLSQCNNNYKLWFSSIANQILQSKLILKDEVFDIIDITIHYTSNDFLYPHCKGEEAQSSLLKWFYYSNEQEILDITFCLEGDSSSKGGVFLRGIKSNKKKIEGAKKIHSYINQILGMEILDSLNGKSAIEGDLRLDLYQGTNLISKYSLPRPNLTEYLKSWSEESALLSKIMPLRFCTEFPKYDSDNDMDIVAVVLWCYIHDYLPEIFSSNFNKKRISDIIKDFESFLENENYFEHKELIYWSKEDIIFKYLKSIKNQ